VIGGKIWESTHKQREWDGRADVIAPLLGTIFEVLVSESKERFESKDYGPFKVVPIKSVGDIMDWMMIHYKDRMELVPDDFSYETRIPLR